MNRYGREAVLSPLGSFDLFGSLHLTLELCISITVAVLGHSSLLILDNLQSHMGLSNLSLIPQG